MIREVLNPRSPVYIGPRSHNHHDTAVSVENVQFFASFGEAIGRGLCSGFDWARPGYKDAMFKEHYDQMSSGKSGFSVPVTVISVEAANMNWEDKWYGKGHILNLFMKVM